MIKRIGLTGGIGSGKTTIAHILEAMSYPIYYSDIRAKFLSDEHPTIRTGLIALLGEESYVDGTLNRVFVSECIFSNPEVRLKVNEIIHPIVRKDFDDWADQQTSSLIFNEAAILFETGAYQQFDSNLLVCAPEALRIQRVMLRDHCSKASVEQRIRSQWTDEQKRNLTSYCVENDGKQPVLIQLEKILSILEG
jgi:dephospho-CoA kinase